MYTVEEMNNGTWAVLRPVKEGTTCTHCVATSYDPDDARHIARALNIEAAMREVREALENSASSIGRNLDTIMRKIDRNVAAQDLGELEANTKHRLNAEHDLSVARQALAALDRAGEV